MQEEVSTKIVAVAIRGSKLTGEMLNKALQKFIKDLEKAEKTAAQPKTYCGKQTVKQLVSQNAAISNIEVTDGNIKGVKVETEEQLLGNRKWKRYVEQYYNAEEMTAEMVDAFISEIRLNSNNTLEITLNYMDEFAEIMSTCERLRKEVA